MSPFNIPDIFKKYGGVLGKGALAEIAPFLFKGALVEILKGTTVQGASRWVEKKVNLWDIIEPQHRESLKRLSIVGDINWLTADWIIQAIKDDHPALASLFLGWKKANNWLEKQVEIIKQEVQE